MNAPPQNMQLKIPTRTKVLFIYSNEYRPFLAALKKQILLVLGNRERDFEIAFVCSAGITKDLFRQVTSGYAYVGISCPATASFVCPEGITFHVASGSLYENKFLILTDPQHIFTVSYGAFLLQRYLAKIFTPSTFLSLPDFCWSLLSKHEDYEKFYEQAALAHLIAIDIETIKKNLAIDCVSFSILTQAGNILTGTLDCTDELFLPRMRRLCALPTPKTFQNGLYDNQYFLRWNSPVCNWVHDTSYFFHSWYAEMEKDLGFLGAFFIRNFEYWKHEGRKAANKEERHRYNAKDAYATLCIAIAQMVEAPAWAHKNFRMNFPLVFPCLYMNNHGVRVDEGIRREVFVERAQILDQAEKSLRTMTSLEDFNAGSSQQVAKLFECFGIKTTTGEKELQTTGEKHPLLFRFVEKILDIREQRKAISSYLEPATPERLIAGRLMYAFNPAATRTARFNCKKSNYWDGVQLQNQPPYAKCYIQADVGWTLGEIDAEQSDSRGMGYLAEDLELIRTLESGKDFHSLNAVKFFGAVYEDAKRKQEDGSDSPVRAIAKKINHGVSFNMAGLMFVYTAGSKLIEMARRELKLPNYLTRVQIADYLIGLFDRSYPKVRNDFQADVKREISFTKRILSPSGWTRWFFSDPNLTKPALNEAVAHGPQHLTGYNINLGLLRIYILMLSGLPIRLLGQIHDSIFFQVRNDVKEEVFQKVRESCHNPIEVKGRVLVIPTALKDCGKYWAPRKKAQ